MLGTSTLLIHTTSYLHIWIISLTYLLEDSNLDRLYTINLVKYEVLDNQKIWFIGN